MKPKMTDTANVALNILEHSQGVITLGIVGTTPLICHAFAFKGKGALLLPPRRMTEADKVAKQKHNPIEEFRNSVDRNHGNDCATRICFPSTGFKNLLGTAALDLPGMRKTEIGRLCWVQGEKIDIWGIPELRMDVVRMAGIDRSPDIRTRACLREWCAVVTVTFVQPKLSGRAIGLLAAAGGMTCGIGDWRQQKGSGSYGQFEVVDGEDERLKRLMATAGREAQDAALADPVCYNLETEELYSWYSAEITRLSDIKKKAA